MFRGGRAEVEDESGKAAGLKQQIGGANGLVEPCPWFGGWTCIPAADPEELAESDAIGSGGFRVEGIVRVDPGTDAALLRAAGKEDKREAGAARGDGARDFADGADWQASVQQPIDLGNACRGGLDDGARHRRERGGEAAFERVLDLN